MPSAEPLLTTVDDAAPTGLFERTLAGLRAVGDDATYWKTFWFPLDAVAEALPEQLALRLARHVPNRDRIVGVEWWLGRMRTTDVPLDFHHDRDLALFEATGRVSHPLWSSVYFLNAVRGGSLLVTDQRLVRRGDEYRLSPLEATTFASVRPAPNRFVRFPGRYLHGVLDANDEVPHGRLPGPPARWRLSIVLNWWTRRPRRVARWSADDAYPELALR